MQTAHPLTIMCFHQKDCNFQGDNMNRQGEGREACKACSLQFQSTKKTLRVINKMAEKNSFIVEEARQFAVTMT